MRYVKRFVANHLPKLDLVFALFVLCSAVLLKNIRKAGIHRMPICRKVLLYVGVFPIVNHYYEPEFDFRKKRNSIFIDRKMGGINLNTEEQLELVKKLKYADELKDVSRNRKDELTFYMNNGEFESGDAEYWYQVLRYFKPKKIFEIGSGNSTLMAINAVRKNMEDVSGYQCKHLCIEPYEMPWLEKTGLEIIRKKVEEVDVELFQELEFGDLLFIDSSHMIRPEGDVVYEFLQLLPTLNEGVIVHVHDIFTPKNYPDSWVKDRNRFWNEQYLLGDF